MKTQDDTNVATASNHPSAHIRVSQFKVSWIDHGREPRCAPNPAFPKGQDLTAPGFTKVCLVELPYPAPRCGLHIVECVKCGARMAITTAGRHDDPRSAEVPCRNTGVLQ